MSAGNRLRLLWPLIVITSMLLGLAAFSLQVMSGARAYVGGESLWSKGQKQAVHHLLEYLRSADQEDYRRYREELGVTLGDRRARQALQAERVDRRAAHEGFLDGGNDPEDIPTMIWLFEWFAWTPLMREPIELWTRADGLLGTMDELASAAHELMRAGSASQAYLASTMLQVRELNRQLDPLAKRFSYSLGETSRSIHAILGWSMLLATVTSLTLGLILTRRMLRDSQQVELDLRNSEASLRVAQSLAHMGSWSYSVAGGSTEWSDEARNILGGASDAPMTGFAAYLDRIDEQDRPHVDAAWQAARTRGVEYDIEYRLRVPGLGSRWIHERGHPLLGGEAQVVGLHGTVMDISERRHAEERVRQLAHFDELTGLPNRTLFQQELQRAIGSATLRQGKLALMFIDLDRFKIINDTLGHDAGDTVLVQVAQRLKACLRDADMVARLGGDEFVLLIPHVEQMTDAAAVAQKALEQVARPMRLGDGVYAVTASIGISVFPDDGSDVDTLRKNADLAMYRAKEKGKNQYEFYAAYLSRRTTQQLTLEADLREAIARQELVLHYQPRMALRGGEVTLTGCEALVRWQHPRRGLVAPGAFIGMAEETGLIAPIGRWVMEEACRQIVSWQAQGHDAPRVSVNVSARQLADEDFLGYVEDVVARTGIAPGMLELELTESMLIDRPERIVGVLERLHKMGITVAIDDFGTGYSSLAYLRRFPIHCIKIDRAFVADLPQDPEACAIVRAILALAGSLQLEVVAEGVETHAQAEYLQAQGCREFQGYLYGKPMPAAEWGALLKPAAAPV